MALVKVEEAKTIVGGSIIGKNLKEFKNSEKQTEDLIISSKISGKTSIKKKKKFNKIQALAEVGDFFVICQMIIKIIDSHPRQDPLVEEEKEYSDEANQFMITTMTIIMALMRTEVEDSLVEAIVEEVDLITKGISNQDDLKMKEIIDPQ